MTQAFNLSQFANKLNSSGQTDNTGLQNSSVTVTAGTGMSGGGSVALGSSVTLTNAGVTSVTAGSGISVSASTGGVTISTSGGGGVTSLNGQTGAITNTDLGSIGSVCYAFNQSTTQYTNGSTVAGSAIRYISGASTSSGIYMVLGGTFSTNNSTYVEPYNVILKRQPGNTGFTTPPNTTALTGTWRYMGHCLKSYSSFDACSNETGTTYSGMLAVRIS